MSFAIQFTTESEIDLDAFTARERRIIIDGIKAHLVHDADQPSRRRKQLRPNPIAPWELRIENYRVFYELKDAQTVTIIATGYKSHNELYIRGQKVEI